jgi:hypothetical protein
LVPPLLARIRAQQYFLAAVEDETPHVIADLRETVYPRYCAARRFGTPIVAKWIEDHHLVDASGRALEWAKSCAEHTLYQWSLNDGHAWAKLIAGRPTLTAEDSGWARCGGLPAFETWLLDENDAYQLVAGLGELPEYTSYDFLIILANGRLAASGEDGYREIPIDMSRFDSFLRYGPFYFDPLKETLPAVRERLTREFTEGLDGFLQFAVATVADWQGYLEKATKKKSEHFGWAALSIAGGQTYAQVAEAIGEDSDKVSTGISEVRKLIGLTRTVGRPAGIKEERPRRARD